MAEERQKPKDLTHESLREAVRSAAAFRLRVRLGGLDGDGGKVFPPTYAGGVYAVEDRRIEDTVVRCVLLDSVQAQANRMEDLVLDAFLPEWRELNPNQANSTPCGLPVVAVHVENHGWVTSLTAPHRIHDAIIRDSEIQQTPNGERVRFRESTIGKEVVAARVQKATALYKYCPTALIFGTWDSTAGEGLDSAKIPRAVVSEIIGVDVTAGVRTASRIDPLGIRAQSAKIYRLKDDPKDWAMMLTNEDGTERVVGAESKEKLDTDKKGNPKRFGGGKPSDINHGNVTPDMPRFDRQEIQKQNLGRLPDIIEATPVELRYDLSSGDGRISSHGTYRSDEMRIRAGAVKPGGITMAYALHTWTLSLTQLRRLRFPIDSPSEDEAPEEAVTEDSHSTTADPNEAARTVLAALSLYALALQQEHGYWLRSRCELVPERSATLELIGSKGGAYALGTAAEMRKLLDSAIQTAKERGLAWPTNVTSLTPTEKLRELVRASDARAPEAEEEEEPADAGAAS